jgi:hypothetical protein
MFWLASEGLDQDQAQAERERLRAELDRNVELEGQSLGQVMATRDQIKALSAEVREPALGLTFFPGASD